MPNEQFSRRGILRVAAACGIAVASISADAAAKKSKPAADSVSANDFATVVGKRFRTTLPNGIPADLKLIEVKELLSSGERPAELSRQSAFVAIFDAPQWMNFEEQIYRVRNRRIGEMDLLLQPVDVGDGKRCLEAVFN